jgi:uncharacterized protein YqgV (UPF0045/DUF77 family)
MSDWMTIKEVAAVLRCSEAAVRYHIKRSGLDTQIDKRRGRRPRIMVRLSDVAKLVGVA